MDYTPLMDSPFPRIAALARRRLGYLDRTPLLGDQRLGLKVFFGEQANIESDRRAAAFDVSKKALSEIKRRLKESAKEGKVRKPKAPRLCAQCQATLTAA